MIPVGMISVGMILKKITVANYKIYVYSINKRKAYTSDLHNK